jgi:glycosyltransferase involved in cell wall biosynthesis
LKLVPVSPLCVHVFPSFGIGGVPLRMARIFNDLGTTFRHVVIALDGKTEAATYISRNIECTVAAAPIPKGNLLTSVLASASELVRRRPDVLVTYNWGAIEWAMANRLATRFPHIHHEAGFGKEEAVRQLRRRVLFRRWMLPHSTIVVPSRTLENIALRDWRLPKEKVLYVPNGIEISRFNISRAKSVSSPSESRPVVIGTLAPLRPEKNVGRLIKAFAIAETKTNLRLLIAGEGSERAVLEEMSQKMGLGSRVTFLGHIDHPASVLSEIDIFALSSDTEQMPNSLLEAMGMALPVAAMDVGDVRQMVASQNKPFLARRTDTHGLAEAITRLAEIGAARSEIGRANRARVNEEYRHEVMVSRWGTILADAARNSNR